MKSFTPLEIKKFLSLTSFRNQKFLTGFTLIETIVTVAIFTLVLGAVFGSIVMLYRSHGYIWEQSQAVEESRRGVEIMTKEIREARSGEDGSYPINLAGDKEIIFFSDIDNDGKTEKVRYFLGTTGSGNQTKECETSIDGGSCSVIFSDFLNGTLKSATVKVSVEGDLGAGNEYVEIFADAQKLGDLCQAGCTDCPEAWQGTTVFDVANLTDDDSITFLADATSRVNPHCPYAMKARFEFSWIEEITHLDHEFKKGVTKATGSPPTYSSGQEEISIISSYVRNAPPIFEYFNKDGNKIEDYPARLKDAKLMKVFLVVNVNPNRPPQDFQLESFVQLRNLKEE